MSTSGLNKTGDGGGGEERGRRLEPGEVGGARGSMERLRVEEGELGKCWREDGDCWQGQSNLGETEGDVSSDI